MEEQLSPLAVTHLLQQTLRSLCLQENSQWVYAVFWRILPRNFPPPKWDGRGVIFDRSRGNRRNWILVWEDGYCNFAASTTTEINTSDYPSPLVYSTCEFQHLQGLQPGLFFKMSHEIYNYGEGLIGKVAADHSHKWIYKEPNEQEINFLSAWQNSADAQPKTWEAHFQSGIKTIALIAVREGVLQLGALHKVIEDLSYVMLLRKKFSYIESFPRALLPHPSSAAFPCRPEIYGSPDMWHYKGVIAPPIEYRYDHFTQPMKITPSMSSLEALLSKLPSVVPISQPQQPKAYGNESQNQLLPSPNTPLKQMCRDKVDTEEKERDHVHEREVGERGSSMSSHHQQRQPNNTHCQQGHDVAAVAAGRTYYGF